MAEPTPPPDEPMPDQSRARIRAELLAAVRDERRQDPRRWAVPLVAAAAVLVVGGVVGTVVSGSDDGDGPVASRGASDPPSPGGSIPASKVPGTQEDHQVDVQELGCRETMESTLPGAQPVASFPEVDGHRTSVWVQGERFSVCDVVDGMTTTHRPLPMTPAPPTARTARTFRVSSAYLPAPGGGFDLTLLAVGVVPAGAMVYDVSYTFPDGARVGAQRADGSDGRTYWRVLHSYVDDGDPTQDPPIEATVSLSGVRQSYQLAWGADTCAQANHGC